MSNLLLDYRLQGQLMVISYCWKDLRKLSFPGLELNLKLL